MEPKNGKTRMNVEGDRLSILPDDLIHKILSFISIKDAVETSVLSSRWKFICASLPYLNFSSEDFVGFAKFHNFITHVLSNRNNQIQVSLIKISFREKRSWVYVKRILKYAFSHNVQQLTVECWVEKNIKFPPSLFSSKSLKPLTLTGRSFAELCMIESTWELPALTALYLDHVSFLDYDTDECVRLFSKCTNLKSLTLSHCIVAETEDFCIFHPRLSDLTLDYISIDRRIIVVKVVAPQLVNLTITNCSGEHLVSAPNLSSLIFNGYHPLRFSAKGFRALEKVDLCICSPSKEGPSKIVGLLQRLHSVRYLMLNSELVEFLSSSVELISDHPSPFSDLKSLTIYPDGLGFWQPDVQEIMSEESVRPEVKSYFLNSSPSAVFTVVSSKEATALLKAKYAQTVMADLRVLLEQEKDNIERQKAKMHEQQKTPFSRMEFGVDIRTIQMNGCWKDLTVNIEQGKQKTRAIVSKLQCIEGLLNEIPASKRAKIQPCFSSLCAEANAVMNQMLGCMKMLWDEKQSCLSVCFDELAPISHPSS